MRQFSILLLILFTMLSCSESIVESVSVPAPDVEIIPQFVLNASTHVVGDFKEQVFRIRNIGTEPSVGTIGVLVSDYPAFNVEYDPNQVISAGLLGDVTVDNPDWTATQFASDIYFETDVVIPAGGESKIALEFEAIIAGQSNDIILNVVIDSGGDIDPDNNTTTKLLIIAL